MKNNDKAKAFPDTGRRSFFKGFVTFGSGLLLLSRFWPEPKSDGAGVIITDKCLGCTSCVAVCPVNAISLDESMPVIDEKCIACGYCLAMCPVGGLTMNRERI